MSATAAESAGFGRTSPHAAENRARGLRRRYYAAVFSAALVMAALGATAAFATNHASTLPDFLGQVALWLIAVNFVGAALMFRPLDRHLLGEAVDRSLVERRIQSLPGALGCWLFLLSTLAMIGHAAIVHGARELLAPALLALHAGTLVHIAVFALYLGLAGYFWTLDYCADLRQALAQQGMVFAPRPGKLILRLTAALLAVALAPALIPISDRWAHSVDPETALSAGMDMQHHQAHMQQALEMDVLGAIFLTILVIVLMARSLSRPVRILLDAMRRVDRGDLEVKVPVVSNDELGMLSEQFARVVDGLRERDRIRKTFGRFVPERVAAALLADEGAMAPKESDATVLFTDVEHFTSIAAGLEPRRILDMLSTYFDEIARIVHAHRGVVTQFQGDAVLASFNLPSADFDHAAHAVQAAFAIHATLDERELPGGIRLRTRIGISSGSVVGGTVGGSERLGYTVHGNTVNLAARLEGLNKELGTRVLICKRTAQLLGERFALRDRGVQRVRGFSEPLRVFEPLAERSEVITSGGDK